MFIPSHYIVYERVLAGIAQIDAPVVVRCIVIAHRVFAGTLKMDAVVFVVRGIVIAQRVVAGTVKIDAVAVVRGIVISHHVVAGTP